MIDTTNQQPEAPRVQEPLECVTCPLSDNGRSCPELIAAILLGLDDKGYDRSSEMRPDYEVFEQYRRDPLLHDVALGACKKVLSINVKKASRRPNFNVNTGLGINI